MLDFFQALSDLLKSDLVDGYGWVIGVLLVICMCLSGFIVWFDIDNLKEEIESYRFLKAIHNQHDSFEDKALNEFVKQSNRHNEPKEGRAVPGNRQF